MYLSLVVVVVAVVVNSQMNNIWMHFVFFFFRWLMCTKTCDNEQATKLKDLLNTNHGQIWVELKFQEEEEENIGVCVFRKKEAANQNVMKKKKWQIFHLIARSERVRVRHTVRARARDRAKDKCTQIYLATQSRMSLDRYAPEITFKYYTKKW